MNNSCENIELCEYFFCNNKSKCLFNRIKIIKGSILSTPKRVHELIKLGHKAECACCDSENNLTFDHVIPISKGGSNGYENGQILCSSCNGIKANKIITILQLKTTLKHKQDEKTQTRF